MSFSEQWFQPRRTGRKYRISYRKDPPRGPESFIVTTNHNGTRRELESKGYAITQVKRVD